MNTTDTPSSRDEEIPTSECCTCGYTWQTGQDGSHSCATQLKEQLIRLSAEREKEREEGIRSVILIRCTKHLTVAQQNANEIMGAECGGCIAEERDHWRQLADLKDAKGEANRTENNNLRATLAARDKELAEVKASFESVANIANARGRKIGELETICLQKDNQVDTLRAQLLAAQTVNGKLRHALEELRAVVKGECPSLLNEDSGGDAKLDLMIEELLTSSPDTTLLDEVVDKLVGLDAYVMLAAELEREELQRRVRNVLSRLRQSTRETEREGL